MRYFRRIVITYTIFVAALFALILTLQGQGTLIASEQKPAAQAAAGDSMGDMDMKGSESKGGDMSKSDMKNDLKELGQANAAMSLGGDHSHHDMGLHMKMTRLRTLREDDIARAQSVVDTARAALLRYQDVSAAKSDGFRQFLPGVKQKMYHFTNLRYAMEAAFRFNPEHPTSLLYEQQPDKSFKLIGAMYTAPKNAGEEELDKRVPLSIAQWHAHVNLCVPPKQQRDEMFTDHPRFGLQGSITTEEACQAAGGNFKPQIFGWMLHLYPYEHTMDGIFSVERQRNTLIPSASNHAGAAATDHQ